MTGESSRPDVRTGAFEQLMGEYQAGSVHAADALVSSLSPQFFQFFLAQVRNRAQAEDLLQDFWLRLHNARATYRRGEPVLPWMYAIARRVRVDQYRKSRRVVRHEIATDELPEQVAWQPTCNSSAPELAELLAVLPSAQREVVVMLKVSGCSLEEVARATGTSVGAVKQKAFRAYEKLRQLFGAGDL